MTGSLSRPALNPSPTIRVHLAEPATEYPCHVDAPGDDLKKNLGTVILGA